MNQENNLKLGGGSRYSGFPKHTYALKWPAPASPPLAARAQALLRAAGLRAVLNPRRGLDHGVFVPLKVAFPKAEIPTIQVSLRRGLDPATHLALGRALAPLRDEGVLIIGSGMSYHNMRGFGRAASLADSLRFDAWLRQTVALPETARAEKLQAWVAAPAARACHPCEEHLLPLMVIAGAAGESAGREIFGDVVMGVRVSAHQFG